MPDTKYLGASTHTPMKNQVVNLSSVKDPVKPSPGFAKKQLSTYKLDIMALCGFGCRYCSSNAGNFLRINRRPFADETERQLGQRLLPAEEPSLTFEWPDVIGNLERQLKRRQRTWGRGETLVFSMLTDGFSPRLVKAGTTRRILEMVLERTSFRIRVLTKNAVVGSPRWLTFFKKHRDRFVVGLSIGTLNEAWARRIEVGTSRPSARLRSLRKLQEAGVPTYGMLCPIFPDVMEEDSLERLVDSVSPHLVEHIWAEPFNDRLNWATVRAGYDEGTPGYCWFTETYEHGKTSNWSSYATTLYNRLRAKAEAEGWLNKLVYLLYEQDIQQEDSAAFRGLRGVLLQSRPAADGRSQNPHLARFQVVRSART